MLQLDHGSLAFSNEAPRVEGAARGAGHIFNVSSLGAYNVGPLSGIYCATKHAVKAISETLAQELAGTGVHVTDVIPGFIRTEFFGSSYKTTAPKGSPYAVLYEENMAFYRGQDGNQAGDPKKVAALYIECAEMDEPWEDLPMGTDCCTAVRAFAISARRRRRTWNPCCLWRVGRTSSRAEGA